MHLARRAVVATDYLGQVRGEESWLAHVLCDDGAEITLPAGSEIEARAIGINWARTGHAILNPFLRRPC